MRFKIDWTSLIVGSKFAVSALFYFPFEGSFAGTSLGGRGGGRTSFGGRFNGGFFPLPVWGGLYLEGLIFGILRYAKTFAKIQDDAFFI